MQNVKKPKKANQKWLSMNDHFVSIQDCSEVSRDLPSDVDGNASVFLPFITKGGGRRVAGLRKFYSISRISQYWNNALYA